VSGTFYGTGAKATLSTELAICSGDAPIAHSRQQRQLQQQQSQ
jgi:hypothetical protein